MNPNKNAPWIGFSKRNRTQRLACLVEQGRLTEADCDFLNHSVDPHIRHIADLLIENSLGCFPIPLGVATHFHIDQKDYLIPMAIEESSVVAAASKTARWIRDTGHITTERTGNQIIGQIQIPRVRHRQQLVTYLEQHKSELIQTANQAVVPGLVRRGGGIADLTLRFLARPDGAQMAVIHVLLNPCNAMGANLVTQVCEFLKVPIEQRSQEKVGLCIVSNHSNHQITQAHVVLETVDARVAEAIEEASLFAELDPYRAATHNKGILNGMDAVLIATGNDWRSVEANIHAYAAQEGAYRPIARWKRSGTQLIGTLKAPIVVGTVGGVTRVHPTAQLCLKLLNIEDAQELSRVIAAVGLVQNLGALRALTTQGITQGHMKLHVNNLILATQAKAAEFPALKKHLEQLLQRKKKLTLSDAQHSLQALRIEKRALRGINDDGAKF